MLFTHKSRTSMPIQPVNSPQVNTNNQAELNFVNWSPKRNDLIIAYANNLYFKANINGVTQQVTYSKTNDQKFGIPDWLYEEEILSKDQAVWWSPNGEAFAYAKFDDNRVSNISFRYEMFFFKFRS